MEPCLPNPCSNDGKCTPLSVDSYNCTCSEGYYGSRCTESDYCALNGGNTFCGDADCKNEQGLKIYYCSCASGQYFDYASRKCLDLDFCPLMKCGENEECRGSRCWCKENYKRDNSTGDCERITYLRFSTDMTQGKTDKRQLTKCKTAECSMSQGMDAISHRIASSNSK
ncbi:hypothetical protein AVEN_134158-1 [Araneus ventricosus]|uniref:EGF-like domain-containing protein n=1 Tax=Araneus ventricosus TaxID=182803 RepID=A0A4Y2E421_ARAVE|nr:hypothetical protein AVEN_134158-1 [Araneus ventricosus]